MSESENRGDKPAAGSMDDLLSAFSLGPAWARGGDRKSSPASKYQARDYEPREDRRGGNRRDARGGQRREGRESRGGGRREDFQNRGRGGRDFRQEPEPPKGIHVEVRPSAPGVHAIAKEIHHLARVYSLFEISKVLLAARDRYQAKFTSQEPAEPLFTCLKDGSLWMSRAEALAHLWNAEWLGEYYSEEQVDVEPPKGNFQGVARCGLSGEYLGPPNFHGYQTAIRRLHRERFAHMSFEQYAAKVRTERGEEAVNAWLESMSKTTRYRATVDETLFESRAEVERHFEENYFAGVFAETREAAVAGDIPAKHLSPPLLTVLKSAAAHARKHPATLIPELCRALEKEHLPIFKRQGKLFTGPARPHPLDEEIQLAERPAQICAWIAEHQEAKLAELWKAVLPEGQDEPTEEWLRDLFWLLSQGHVLLLPNDELVLPVRKPKPEPAPEGEGGAKKKRKRNRKRKGRPLGGVKAKVTELRKAGTSKRPLKVTSRKRVEAANAEEPAPLTEAPEPAAQVAPPEPEAAPSDPETPGEAAP